MEMKKIKFTERHDEIWKFIKFSFAGISSFVVQYLFDLLFHYVIFAGLRGRVIDNAVFRFLEIDSQMDAAFAYLIAAAIGYFVAYLMNRKVTFNSSSNLALSVFLYIVMVLVTIFVTAWLKAWLVNLAVTKGYVNADGTITWLADTIIFIVTVTIPFVWTYPLQRFVINPPKKQAKAPEENA